MARHKHRFIAIPITGQNAWTGKEALFGWRLECEICYKQAKPGDTIEEIKSSWWKEIVPESKLVNIIVPEGA
jgi:hypothetical protein